MNLPLKETLAQFITNRNIITTLHTQKKLEIIFRALFFTPKPQTHHELYNYCNLQDLYCI
jgi:hypothetical protein